MQTVRGEDGKTEYEEYDEEYESEQEKPQQKSQQPAKGGANTKRTNKRGPGASQFDGANEEIPEDSEGTGYSQPFLSTKRIQ